MTHPFMKFLYAAIGFWVVILIASVLGAMALQVTAQGIPDDGPLDGGQAFLVVNALHALVLAAIASRARIRGWKLGILLGSTLFLAQCFLLLIEALYFAGSVGAPLSDLFGWALQTVCASLAVAIVAALIWRAGTLNDKIDLKPRRLIPLIALVSLLYVFAYFTAGFFIAWAVPSVREFYGDGHNISLLPLLAFQVFRGAIWALLALAIVRSLRPGILTSAAIVGATFAVLASAQLLYPNALMPWEVRWPHLIEVTISNFLFGAIAAIILRAPVRTEQISA